MKIVIATSVYTPQINGVAVFSHNLAMGLARRGHEVVVLTPSQTGKKYSRLKDGVKIFYLKSTTFKVYPDQIHQVEPKKKILGREMPRFFYKHGFRASVFPARQIEKILNKFDPDIIHVQGSDPIGVTTVNYAHKHNIPVVLTEHNQPEVLTEPLHLPSLVQKPVDRILSAYFVDRQKKVDYVTMPTQLSIEHLLKGRDLGVPVEAVSNGVDLSAFKPGEASREVYTKYDIPTDVPIVLYTGRLDPEKKVGVVLEAFSEFLDKHKDNKLDRLSKALFVVVGDGVDKNRLILKAEKMGLSSSVRFLGRVVGDDLYNIYRMGEVFATASEIETQGIVLIEAAAASLPLIAVDAGAVKEICRDGQNGYLLEPGDTKGIAEAIDRILSDNELKARMSKKSLEIASEHDLNKTLDKFIRIYENLLKRV